MNHITKRMFSLLLVLAMLVSVLPGFSLSAHADGGTYVQASSVEVGKTYVIVADGQYAMNNRQEGPALRSYAGSATTTLASTPVEITDGVITSVVTDDMLWTICESTADPAYDGEEQYFIQDCDGNYLRRGSGSSGKGAQLLCEAELYSTIRYNAWTFKAYEGEDGVFAMYANSEREYGRDYPFYVFGNETSFDSPGSAQRSPEDPFAFMNNDDCSKITLYELSGGTVTSTINFADTADAGKYEILGQTSSEVTQDVGLTLVSTLRGIEPAGTHYQTGEDMLSGEDANTPVDMVKVPVSADWTATLNFAFTAGGQGYYEFFGFYAMQGEDYRNLVGIRAGDGDFQDFLRQDGEITAATKSTYIDEAGLTAASEYWFRIEKSGDNYTCSASVDGEEYIEFFSFEGTGIEADYLIIDAYSGMSTGFSYTLKTLTIETEISLCAHEYEESVVEPTCTLKGYTLHTCTLCGRAYKSDFTDPLGHTYPAGEDVVIPPTCTEEGYTERTCSRCGEVGKFDVVEALGHDFGEYEKTKDFTETERGELTAHCSRCDATKTRPIAAGNEKPHKNQILFISDVHSARKAGWDRNDGFHNLRALFPLLKSEDDFIPEVVCGGGDYIESSTNDSVDGRAVNWPQCYEVLHDVIYNGAPDTYQALTSGNHEWEWSQQSDAMIEKLLGQPRVCNSYNSDDFTVFQIGAHMNGTGQENLRDADVAKLAAFLEEEANSGKNRVVFIQTHWPLHYAYNHAWRTTQNAGKVIDLLNSYADRLDICWVWGHNHRHDANRHMFRTRNYIMQTSSSEYKKIRFNYFNAGCLNENGAEQDTGPSGSNYGPGYCLEARLEGDMLTLDYAHITGAYPDPTKAKLDHNADLLYVQPIQEARESHAEIRLVHHGDCEHDYQLTHVEPTCLDWGTNNYKCSKCGLEYHDDVDEPLGHDWDEGVITTEPTETEKGVKTFTCSRCGETKTKAVPRLGITVPENIDFTTADSADLYEIVNPSAAEQTEDGLVTTTTRPAMEDCNGRNSDDQATTPEDLIKVPVFDNWTATLTFDFDTNSASNGYYQFFGFYAAEGEDYQNLAGIRGGDKAFQDFLRIDGEITADTDDVVSAPGLDTIQTYWLRIEKAGDNYYCYRSDDGEEFTEMFTYEGTGIDADYIIIDAYTGMTTGYKFTLKSLEFDEAEHEYCQHDYVKTHVDPTCVLPGYDSFVCSKCGAVKTENAEAALGHEYENGKCVRCGQPESKASGSLADTVHAGGRYVVVSNDYAMTNGGADITGTAVTVEGDVITSEIADNMIWEFTEGTSDRAGSYTTGYFLKNGDGDYILARASSGGSGTASLNTNTYTPDTAKSETKEYYCYWIVQDLDGGNKAIFLYSDRGDSEYAWAIHGGTTFNAPGRRVTELDTLLSANPLRLYEITGEDMCQHEYTEVVTAPTCFERGFTTKTCSKCGQVSVTDVLEPLGHDFVDGVCSRCGAKSTKEPEEPPFLFDDVKDKNDYFFEPVYWAFNHDPQITTGTTKTTFGPEEGCTRAQVVTFLWRAAGKPAVTGQSNPFKDVPLREYYTEAVLWAVKEGITTGTDADKFSPEETCTRAQIVTFLWRYEKKPAPASANNPFKDVPAGEYYTDAVLWAVEKGVTKGTDADAFSPEETCTRAQIVTFLYRDVK